MLDKKINRVKLFTSGWASSLEANLNEWLAERGPGFKLLDVKYGCAVPSTDRVAYSALVIYEEAQGDD